MLRRMSLPARLPLAARAGGCGGKVGADALGTQELEVWRVAVRGGGLHYMRQRGML
jgi:hypothetical protein